MVNNKMYLPTYKNTKARRELIILDYKLVIPGTHGNTNVIL